MVAYSKHPHQGPFLAEPQRSWGLFTRYIEIGEARYALRHVDAYENGNLLKYDRTHWVDSFGVLPDARFSPKKWEKWWGPSIEIDASEFEAVWRVADASPTRQQQILSAKMHQLGAIPTWLI